MRATFILLVMLQFVSPFINHVKAAQQMDLNFAKGRLVMLNFWASWCPPCHHEMSDIVALYTKYHQQVIFIGVNLTDSDSIQGAQQFIRQYHVPYRIVYDRNNELAQSFGILAIPTTLLLNRDGSVAYRITGEMPQVLHRTLAQFVHQDSKRVTLRSKNGA